jgi:predicted methyltransferase
VKGTHDIRKRLFEALQIKRGEKEGAAATKVLKSAGVFGVVEHRARPFADAETRSKALYRIKGIT